MDLALWIGVGVAAVLVALGAAVIVGLRASRAEVRALVAAIGRLEGALVARPVTISCPPEAAHLPFAEGPRATPDGMTTPAFGLGITLAVDPAIATRHELAGAIRHRAGMTAVELLISAGLRFDAAPLPPGVGVQLVDDTVLCPEGHHDPEPGILLAVAAHLYRRAGIEATGDDVKKLAAVLADEAAPVSRRA